METLYTCAANYSLLGKEAINKELKGISRYLKVEQRCDGHEYGYSLAPGLNVEYNRFGKF